MTLTQSQARQSSDKKLKGTVRRLINLFGELKYIFQTDDTKHRTIELALAQTQTRLSRIVNLTSDALVVLDGEGLVRFVNPAAEKLFGRPREQILNEYLGSFSVAKETTELSIHQPSGHCLVAEMRITEIPWDDEIAHLASLRDITERYQAQEKLHHLAFHDALTGLPNRSLFLDRLEHAFQRSHRSQTGIAVLFIDLDHFKWINDSYGHLIADQLLKSFSQRVQSCLRTSDTLARIGGDEFTILLEDLLQRQDAIEIANRIQEQLQAPFELDDQVIFVKASIGIAKDIDDYQDPSQLLQDADVAMYRAKRKGRGCYVVFNPQMRQESLSRLRLEAELRQALNREELEVYYQPILDLSTEDITGFEALVRWNHPQLGLLLPNEFISMAEEIGIIVAIDTWVLDQACQQLKKWRRQCSKTEALTMSINLSSQQLSEPCLFEQIHHSLQSTGLDAESLKLELTETSLIENLEGATLQLEQLSQHNIRLCLDDFGTGYSSLSYLNRFPVNCLKIDRSFVSQMEDRPYNWEIIRTIIGLSHTMGLETVAEGIENQQQLTSLKSLGCDLGQGFLFRKPVPAKDATALLNLYRA